MRGLHYFNLVGVAALAVLCAFQWRINRELNLRINGLEKQRIEHLARIEEQDKQIKGQAGDLDAFREHLQRTTAELKTAESNLLASRHEVFQLSAERDQLKESVVAWSKAVAERDEQLKTLSEKLQELAGERNDAVIKFNELAEKHNEVVHLLNERTREFNSLVERFNQLAKGNR